VESVLKQDDPGFEIIITDDSSDAQVQQLVAAEWNSVPAVRYYRNEQRLGYPRNFNRGIAESIGQWVVTLADDDYLLPGALAVVQALAKILVGPGLIFPGPAQPSDREVCGIRYRHHLPGSALGPLQGKAPSTVFFSRQLFQRWGGYDDRYLASDEELWVRYARTSPCIEVTSHRLAHYRLHDRNLGLDYLKRFDNLTLHDAVSDRLAAYAGLAGAERDAFVLARRTTAIRFGISRGLQLHHADLIRRYAKLMCATRPCRLYTLMAHAPRTAAAAYVVYRWARKRFGLRPLFS
jgi:glycosyltransferase involved in cell wall biosynthesis